MRRWTIAFLITLMGAGSVLTAPAEPAVAQATEDRGAATPAGTMAVPRQHHTATPLPDGRVLVVGGWNEDGYLPTAELWDPTTRSFEQTGSLATARSGHSAFAQPDGGVLIIGGWGGDKGIPVAEAERWNPETGAFEPAGALATPRMEATLTELSDGRVLVVGGRFHDEAEKAEPVVEAEVWDPATSTFGPAGSTIHLREYHTTLALPDGGAIVIGGPSREALYWNATTDAFESAGQMAQPREYAVLLADGRVLAIGVVDPITCKPGKRYAETPDAELWDPRTFSFEPAGAFKEPRRPMDTVALDDGRVLVYGGWNAVCNDSIAFKTAEAWDPTTLAFDRAGEMQERRQYHTTTPLPDGRVAFIGGMAQVVTKETRKFTRFKDVSQDEVELWDPATDRFVRAGKISQPRQEHTATLLHDGSILLIGGSEAPHGKALASAETWTPPPAAGADDAIAVPEVILPRPPGIPVGVAPAGEMTTQRWEHSATPLEDGRVLITGGSDGSPAELFDPATGMFSPTGSMSESRVYHTATRLEDGTVLVVGGLNEPATAEIYDPTSGRFRPVGAPVGLTRFRDAILLEDGRVLVIGPSDAELYDPTSGTFAKLPDMTRVKDWGQLALLPDGRVLVVGVGPWKKARAEAEVFDPLTESFSPVPIDRELAEGHTLTPLADGRVLLAGGWGDRRASHLFDPATGAFRPTGRLKVPRGEHEAVALPDGRVLLIGGHGERGPTRSIEAFDPATKTYAEVGRLKEVRSGFRATLLDDGRVLITGGDAGSEGGRPPRHAEIFDPLTGASTFTGEPAS